MVSRRSTTTFKVEDRLPSICESRLRRAQEEGVIAVCPSPSQIIYPRTSVIMEASCVETSESSIMINLELYSSNSDPISTKRTTTMCTNVEENTFDIRHTKDAAPEQPDALMELADSSDPPTKTRCL
ncbi:hypothetical protein H2248_002264 [Termitomyces sp. 'cryptogamus']|nr:hypothetical protein H2248_002264 [Termitomyces sp. 'cryptogamus']